MPNTITAGGITREVTLHGRNDVHKGVTPKRIERLLNEWAIRGNCVDSQGSRTVTYWGFVPGLRQMMRVAVRIVTAYPDRAATRHWNRGSRTYFEQRCSDLEEQNAGDV